MTKAELRKIYLAKQRDLACEGERIEKNRKIAERVFATFDLTTVKILHCFITIKKFNEIDTFPIFERIWNDFPQIITVAPRVDFGTHNIESIVIRDRGGLVPNVWGIEEPRTGEIIDERSIDIALVPGIAFDMQFHRVGYGKGFYDRFLSKCRHDCVKVGLSLFPPAESIDDVNDHDVPMDYLITPDESLTAVLSKRFV